MFLKLFSSSKPEPDDLELVRQYRETGDPEGLGRLFERHTEMVYLVCYKYLKDEEESKDAAMEIFDVLADMQNGQDLHPSPGAGLEADLTLLEKGLEALPPDQRDCVALFYLQQKSYKEIAAQTGLDLNKVRSHIQNGRRNLKIYLEKHHEPQ